MTTLVFFGQLALIALLKAISICIFAIPAGVGLKIGFDLGARWSKWRAYRKKLKETSELEQASIIGAVVAEGATH